MRHSAFIVMIVLLTQAFTGTAQETAIISIGDQNTIVRQWRDGEIYYGTAPSKHYFALHLQNDPYNVIVADFPFFLDINDFEVFLDTVFFCGSNPNMGNPYGIVGAIAVDDLFYNNQPYDIGVLNTIYHFWDQSGTNQSSVHIVSAERMDVYEDDQGIVHIVFVGESDLYESYGQEPRRTVCDVYRDYSFYPMVWQGTMLYNKDNMFYPTDVTCTEKYIAVVGENKKQDSYNVKSYFQSFMPTETSLENPVWPGSAVSAIDNKPLPPYLIERTIQDSAVIVFYYIDTNTMEYGSSFVLLEDVSQLPFTTFYAGRFIQTTLLSDYASWKLYDLRYCKDELLLLHNTNTPLFNVTTPSIFHLNTLSIPTMTFSDVWYCMLDVDLLSIDNRQRAFFSTSGIHNPLGKALLSREQSQSTQCYNNTGFDFYDHTPYIDFNKTEYDEELIYIRRAPNYPYYPTPYISPVDIKCP